MGNENPTGICKPQILRNTSYIVTSEEVFVEGVVMIIFPKEMKFLYDHHRKGDEPWRKSPQVYVKPEGITSIVSLISTYRDAPETSKAGFRIQLGRPSLPSAFAKNEMYCWPTRRIVFPVTILSKRGSASLILIMSQKEIKKSTLLDRKRVEYARQKDLQSSTPSYRS